MPLLQSVCLAGFRDGDAFAIRRMGPLRHLDRGRRVVGVGGLLLPERLDVALAVLVDVVDDPSFLRAVRVGPGPLTPVLRHN